MKWLYRYVKHRLLELISSSVHPHRPEAATCNHIWQKTAWSPKPLIKVTEVYYVYYNIFDKT